MNSNRILIIVSILFCMFCGNTYAFEDKNEISTATLKKLISNYGKEIDNKKKRVVWGNIKFQMQELAKRKDTNLLEIIKDNYNLKSPRLSSCTIECYPQYIALIAYREMALNTIVDIATNKDKFFHPAASFTIGILVGKNQIDKFCSERLGSMNTESCSLNYYNLFLTSVRNPEQILADFGINKDENGLIEFFSRWSSVSDLLQIFLY